jgi:hypothetical protein
LATGHYARVVKTADGHYYQLHKAVDRHKDQSYVLHVLTQDRHEAAALSDVYVDVPRSAFSADDFVDGEHFAARGSLKFARMVAPKIADACHRRP